MKKIFLVAFALGAQLLCNAYAADNIKIDFSPKLPASAEEEVNNINMHYASLPYNIKRIATDRALELKRQSLPVDAQASLMLENLASADDLQKYPQAAAKDLKERKKKFDNLMPDVKYELALYAVSQDKSALSEEASTYIKNIKPLVPCVSGSGSGGGSLFDLAIPDFGFGSDATDNGNFEEPEPQFKF